MSKIISIGTAVPEYKHEQKNILDFMQRVYALDEVEKRKLKFLYNQSGILNRYSVLSDYGLPASDWTFYPASENLEPFPNLELRMKWFNKTAPSLSVNAIQSCLEDSLNKEEITHLVTVTCTGMSAPGLDLQVMEAMNLKPNIFRTSVNFMGCYAAIHAMKLADAFCQADEKARVLIVCTELCTLHFQQNNSVDNITSSLLFGDGAAAILVTPDSSPQKGFHIDKFYSEVSIKGKKDMSWEISSSGFLMTLSGYIPQLVEEDFNTLVEKALDNAGIRKVDITNWCIHPGGKKILSAIQKSINISEDDLRCSYEVLQDYGNMSSPTILFVLDRIKKELRKSAKKKAKIFGAAFGPGLTMETFLLSND